MAVVVKRVENAAHWFRWIPCVDDDDDDVFAEPMDGYRWEFLLGTRGRLHYAVKGHTEILVFLRTLSDKKIGEITARWEDQTPIEYKYAKVRLGNVFDYYTTSDGVLKVPNWVTFKYAVEEYLENDPRIKYHPSRVREFIEERGINHLEEME